MMRYGIIIQARMSSQRMPGKVLATLLGRPMLSFMLERVRSIRGASELMIATSTDSSDDPIEELCRSEGIRCYRGSLDDVLDRYYQAARLLHVDVVVRLTGDCPLMDPAIVDGLIGLFESRAYDYLANCAPPPGTFPDGMDVEIFSFQALENAWREAKKPSEREHVTFYFWQNPGKFRTFRFDRKEDLSALRLTVDYPEDFKVVNAIASHLFPKNPRFTMEEIVALLKDDPSLLKENQGIKRNQGWESAFQKDREAGKANEAKNS